MPRDGDRDSLYLTDIVEAAQTVARWIDDHGDGWRDDEILLNAVPRQLMVVGEAANCLSSQTRERLPDVPWHRIRGFRNHAVHAYFSIDWAIVCEIAVADLPDLRRRAMVLLRADYPEIAAALDGRSQMPPA
ncbi:MAG TPA: HepT-like ribonuclease domain-containing protein [Actinophytocola sp.]|uniref:HepT-like ribonuclease domain-containing protein n=1 Tax=Actinophytocola sp. TaxID=1872138 RepID=UPI002DDD795C|nr:HepT-like ribonuclease domain-containing protein [Actinophytocola sp.]HEV2779436.1 HepT-like ribonuclease domain-containing protein [Actinophytocola sp.]